jgi:hypothetical protein
MSFESEVAAVFEPEWISRNRVAAGARDRYGTLAEYVSGLWECGRGIHFCG